MRKAHRGTHPSAGPNRAAGRRDAAGAAVSFSALRPRRRAFTLLEVQLALVFALAGLGVAMVMLGRTLLWSRATAAQMAGPAEAGAVMERLAANEPLCVRGDALFGAGDPPAANARAAEQEALGPGLLWFTYDYAWLNPYDDGTDEPSWQTGATPRLPWFDAPLGCVMAMVRVTGYTSDPTAHLPRFRERGATRRDRTDAARERGNRLAALRFGVFVSLAPKPPPEIVGGS